MIKVKNILILLILFTLFSPLFAGQSGKKNIAVMDLESRGSLNKEESGTLTDRLRSMLVRTNAFVVVDRGKMQEILDEQGFQLTGCTSAECAVEAGKILGVEAMVAGTVGRLGKLYTLDITLIDVETSQIIKSLTRDYSGEIEGLVGLMKSVADELAGKTAVATETKKIAKKKFTITFVSVPEAAQVTINGKVSGSTPLQHHAEDGSKLSVVIQKDKYKTFNKNLVVIRNQVVRATLKPLDGFASKKPELKKAGSGGGSGWLYWVGGGVVIAAAAAYFLMPKSADSSTTSTTTGFPAPPGRP